VNNISGKMIVMGMIDRGFTVLAIFFTTDATIRQLSEVLLI
jgi:hypothetical protein